MMQESRNYWWRTKKRQPCLLWPLKRIDWYYSVVIKWLFFLWGEKINTKNFNDMTRFSPYKTNFCIWMVLLLALIRRFPGDRQYKSYRVFPIWWLSIQIFYFFKELRRFSNKNLKNDIYTPFCTMQNSLWFSNKCGPFWQPSRLQANS